MRMQKYSMGDLRFRVLLAPVGGGDLGLGIGLGGLNNGSG